MSEERQMTIAKGLGRIKIIRKELDSIKSDLSQFAAWNSKKKCPLGIVGNDSVKLTAAETINVAQEKVNSLYQQYNDLLTEMLTLRRCIDKTNALTNITVAGKTMTIHEAILYKKEIIKQQDAFATNIISCFSRTEREVEFYNDKINASNALPEADRKILMADVVYFINRNKIEETKNWSIKFLAEINDELNAVNAVTNIIF